MRSVAAAALMLLSGSLITWADQSTLEHELTSRIPVLSGISLVSIDIPTKSCPTSGMADDTPAPALPLSIALPIPPSLAKRVTYYQAEWKQGVIGPNNWTCQAQSGSDGIALYVAPPGTNLLAGDGFSGPVIVRREFDGGTSGRFAVAEVAARVFPILKDFSRRVAAEHADAGRIVFSPYPYDKIDYLSDRSVIYETPASKTGMGLVSGIRPDAWPIKGFAVISDDVNEPQLSTLSVHLGPADAELYPAILANSLFAILPAMTTPQAPAAPAETLNEGWWAIVASQSSQDLKIRDDSERIRASASRCGYHVFSDFSSKFIGFAPGFNVFVVGAYRERAEAKHVAERLRPCLPGTFVKFSRYLGE